MQALGAAKGIGGLLQHLVAHRDLPFCGDGAQYPGLGDGLDEVEPVEATGLGKDIAQGQRLAANDEGERLGSAWACWGAGHREGSLIARRFNVSAGRAAWRGSGVGG